MTGGIEVTPGGSIVATGDGVTIYDLLSNRSALKLTIVTGMKLRHGFNHVDSLIRRGYISPDVASIRPKAKREREAYRQLDELIASLPGGRSIPLPPGK